MTTTTPSDVDMNRILEKVKKCLALTASDQPGEAAAALRQARKLMDKYGITEAQVKLAEVKAVKTAKTPPARDRAGKLVAWIAQAFACKPLLARNDAGEPVFEFIGKGHYPELAEYTYSVLWRRLDRESKAFREQMLCSLTDPDWDLKVPEDKRRHKWATEDARKATTAFCEGWLHRVGETVRSFAGHEPDQDVDDWVANKYGKLRARKARQHRDLDADGVRAGLDAGSRVSLHHGVNGRSATGQRLLA